MVAWILALSARHREALCATCHPASAPHIDGTVDVATACNGCHGSAASPAPPGDLAGNQFTTAIGVGANPARSGTDGGGSGAAIYNDGNTFTLSLCGVAMTDNHANEGGGGIFFVSNDRTGHLVITDSVLQRNPSDGFETQGFPGIFYLGDGPIQVTNSQIE